VKVGELVVWSGRAGDWGGPAGEIVGVVTKLRRWLRTSRVQVFCDGELEWFPQELLEVISENR
jgi:hypothetical protein